MVRGDNFFFRTERRQLFEGRRLFEGGDFFKYFSQEVVPQIFCLIIPYIQKISLPFLVDDDVVDLIGSIPIRGSPAQLVDISVGKTVPPQTRFNKPLSVTVGGSATEPLHCILSPALIILNLSIQISSYQ